MNEDPYVQPSPQIRPIRAQKFLLFKLRPEDMDLLDQLSDDQRKILLSNGSYKERAAQLEIPLGTVRSRLHRARSALEHLRLQKEGASVLVN